MTAATRSPTIALLGPASSSRGPRTSTGGRWSRPPATAPSSSCPRPAPRGRRVRDVGGHGAQALRAAPHPCRGRAAQDPGGRRTAGDVGPAGHRLAGVLLGWEPGVPGHDAAGNALLERAAGCGGAWATRGAARGSPAWASWPWTARPTCAARPTCGSRGCACSTGPVRPSLGRPGRLHPRQRWFVDAVPPGCRLLAIDERTAWSATARSGGSSAPAAPTCLRTGSGGTSRWTAPSRHRCASLSLPPRPRRPEPHPSASASWRSDFTSSTCAPNGAAARYARNAAAASAGRSRPFSRMTPSKNRASG